MDFSKARDLLFVGMFSAIALYSGSKIGKASDSIVDLNAKVGTLIERSESHKERLDRIEIRLYELINRRK